MYPTFHLRRVHLGRKPAIGTGRMLLSGTSSCLVHGCAEYVSIKLTGSILILQKNGIKERVRQATLQSRRNNFFACPSLR